MLARCNNNLLAFFITTHQLFAQLDVRAFVFVIEGFADVVNQRGAFANLNVGADFSRNRGRKRRDFHAVFENILTVRGAIKQTPEYFEHRFGQAHADFGCGFIRGFAHFGLHFESRLVDHVFDARRMNAAIGDEVRQSDATDLAAHRLETRNHHGFRRIVDDEIAAGKLLESADVAAFAPDDAAFEVFRRQRHNRNAAFRGLVDGATLNGQSEGFARVFLRIVAHFVFDATHDDVHLVARFFFDTLNKNVARFALRKVRDAFEFGFLRFEYSFGFGVFGHRLAVARFDGFFAAIQIARASIDLRFAFAQTLFHFLDFAATFGSFALDGFTQTRDFALHFFARFELEFFLARGELRG